MKNSIEKKQNLTDKQLSLLQYEMYKRKKSVPLAYVLFIFFGWLGLHKFYMGQIVWGLAYPGLALFGWTILVLGMAGSISPHIEFLSPFSFFALIIIWVVDLFTMPRQVAKADEKTEKKIMQSLLEQN